MDTILISPKNKNELEFISELLKRMQIKIKMLSVDDIEDLGMLKAMEEGRKTKFVSKERIMNKLKR